MRTITTLLFLALFSLLSARGDCYEPMPEEIFDQHHRFLSETRSTGERLDMSRQLARNNCLTTLQIADLMDLFPHDGQRLELARSAYSAAVDPQNYLMLVDLLYETGHRQELYRWVSNQQAPYARHHGGPPPHAPAHGYYKKKKKGKHDKHHDKNHDRYEERYPARPPVVIVEPVPRRPAVRVFGQIIIEIGGERNPGRQLQLAQNYVSSGPANTREVLRLMRELPDDRTRMSFARYAYPHVSDPHQYRQVVSGLQQPRYQSEMRSWLTR